ncbi:MAG: hypothetical protein F6J93_32750 [Oscillatoria sp. SIO1A7]|nr:hypothetical protein [Oscillatoria sp. SIO1A7]
MDIVSTNITIINTLKNQSPVELAAKVDTGSILLVIPGEIARQFEFPAIRTELVKYANDANEETAKRTVVGAVQRYAQVKSQK